MAKSERNGHMISEKRIWLLGLLLLSAFSTFATSGCRLRPRMDSNEVHVRLINAVSDADALNVTVDGQRAWKRATFRSNTRYEGIAAGTYTVRIDADRMAALPITNRPMAFQKGHWYTILALGRVGDAVRPAQALVQEEDGPGRIPSGKASLRLINASSEAGPLDLVVNNIVGLKSVEYGRRSVNLILDNGAYDMKVVSADTPDALAGPLSLRLEAGHAYTLVTMGQASNQNLTLEAYSDNP